MMSLPSDGTAVRPVLSTQTALLVVDVQTYGSDINKGNDYYAERAAGTVSNINLLAAEFRSKPEFEVVFTFLQSLTSNRRDIATDYKLSGPALCNIPGPNEKNIFLESCQPEDSDILIPKTACSVFHSTNIHYVLSNLGIRHLVIVGQLTDQCITSAARDAADLGYFVTVVPDACMARSAADEDRGRRNVEGFCRILNTDAVLKEARAAQPPEYKLLRALVSFLKAKGHDKAAQLVLAEFCKEKTNNSGSSPGTQATEAPSVDSIIDLLVQAPASAEEKDGVTGAVDKEAMDPAADEAPQETQEVDDDNEGPACAPETAELDAEEDKKEESSSSFLLADDSFLKVDSVQSKAMETTEEESPPAQASATVMEDKEEIENPIIEAEPTAASDPNSVSKDPPSGGLADYIQETMKNDKQESEDNKDEEEIPVVVSGSRSFLSSLTETEDDKMQTEVKVETHAVVDDPEMMKMTEEAIEENAYATEPAVEEPVMEEDAVGQFVEIQEEPTKKEQKEVSFIGLAKLLQGTNKKKATSDKGRSKITDKDITTLPRRQLRDPAGVKKETKSFIGRTF